MSKYFPFGASTYFLNSSIGSSDATITLSSFIEPVTGTPYTMALLNTDIVFGTVAPKTSTSEFISFTGITQNADGTATLTGVTRGLAKKYPFTSSSSYKQPHAGQSIFIISDAPQVFNEYATLINDQIFIGQITFLLPPIGINPGGVANASTTVSGIVQEATQAQIDAKTAAGSTGARLYLNPPTLRSTLLSDYVADTGVANAYAIAPSPVISGYTIGQIFSFKATNANTTSSTLNVNGLGVKSITKLYNASLVANDILANQIVIVQYDGTEFQMINNSGRDFVDVTTNQTVGGLKTFTTLPQSAATPSASADFVTKAYVDSAPRFSIKNGIATRTDTTASGNQTIAHGLGRAPIFVRITTVLQPATAASVDNGNAMSWGTYNGTTTSCVWAVGLNNENGNVSAATGNDSTNIIVLQRNKSGSTASQVATIGVDATNITLAWTLSGTMAGNTISIMWEVF